MWYKIYIYIYEKLDCKTVAHYTKKTTILNVNSNVIKLPANKE